MSDKIPGSQSPHPSSAVAGHVLVVDDDPEAVRIIAQLLALRNFTTRTAGNGEEGLRLARSEPFDAILLDVVMPGMDGLEVCRELAKDERTKSIPVILLTGKDDHQTRAAGMTLGVSEFLTKPVNKIELYTRVQAQVHAAAQARELERALSKL